MQGKRSKSSFPSRKANPIASAYSAQLRKVFHFVSEAPSYSCEARHFSVFLRTEPAPSKGKTRLLRTYSELWVTFHDG